MPTATPKSILNLKYGSQVQYKTEEVVESCGNGCPGLVMPQQSKCGFRCCLELPEFTVTSDVFTRKKDAEQAAAKLALEKLGIQSSTSSSNQLTMKEKWEELAVRVSLLFTDGFLLSPNPLVNHFGQAIQREGCRNGFIPASVLPTCDSKMINLCKSINPRAVSDPFLTVALIMKAAKLSDSICASDRELWIWRQNPYSSEVKERLANKHLEHIESCQLEAVHIPCSLDQPVEPFLLQIHQNEYYMDVIAQKLNVEDATRVLISRPVGKASSEIRVYFTAPDIPIFLGDPSLEVTPTIKDGLEMTLNARASYFSSQVVYGDAVVVSTGYTWRSTGLFHENFLLCSYYRMLLSKLPDGSYKLSRDSIILSELPASYTTRSNWRGTSPRDLLTTFCHQHRLSDPIINTTNLDGCVGDANSEEPCEESLGKVLYKCAIKILSKEEDILIECFPDVSYRRQHDAIQNAALKVLTWLNWCLKNLDLPIEKMVSLLDARDIRVSLQSITKEFALCGLIYGGNCTLKKLKSLRPFSIEGRLGTKLVDEIVLLGIEGADSGASPTVGSLVCISYSVILVGEHLEEPFEIERKDEFELEIGVGAIEHQLETSLTQMSVNQTAQLRGNLPSMDLILAAAGDAAETLPRMLSGTCSAEYTLRLLQVSEPYEDRIEQAFFTPSLSKQRMEFALHHIKELDATTLVDFGCGSGGLFDGLFDHTTVLEKVVGVDLSRRGLTRAAKQVIEHMEEDQAQVFGDLCLGSFCPQTLIVSTPNHEYNPILQRAATPDLKSPECPKGLSERDNVTLPCMSSECPKELEEGETFTLSCKFRNFDHKFEWTRKQFSEWATKLALRHGYSVEFSGVGGSADIEPGFASQIAVFKREKSDISQNGARSNRSEPYNVLWEWKAD
ncbi:small RNA 2'-O-methyltransferase [Amborella trichopoda]|uniref:small RNA 2'-O-methyltransferase n=1 Tax=Amborella trichopoda TaxID=13333 RepID=UPI0009BDFFBC|nr:small RNA 2'-O-methyltransferase [Amborella trichopoda]|eukprot:XP_020518606.1 small RNA 2'-O-methyltransferase [Amborella trichopoda]